jgi:hypothetical protein
MKKLLTLSILFLLTVGPALAQTRQSDPNEGHNLAKHHFDLGWLGMAGLLGLMGLRRPKSAEHQRMEAAGIKVSTVPVHFPEKS